MKYTINCLVSGAGFGVGDARARAALTETGFSVLTEIEFKATMKNIACEYASLSHLVPAIQRHWTPSE